MKFKLANAFVPYGEYKAIKFLAVSQAIFLVGLWILAPESVLPSPTEILRAWHRMASEQGLLLELINSSKTIAVALFWSTLFACLIAYLSTAVFFKPIARWASSLRFLGLAGITFLFTLMTSSGAELKIWLLTFGMTVFLLTNLLAMVDSVTLEEVDYARTLKLSNWRITYEVVMRGRLDETIDLIRQNMAIGWTMLSMVEGLVRYEGGIGALLLNQNKHFNLAAVFAIQLTILLYGIFQDILLKYLKGVICPYTQLSSVR